MVLREYLLIQYTNTETLRRTFKSVLEKNRGGLECLKGLQEETLVKITSYRYHLMKSTAVRLYTSLLLALDDSQMADLCEEDNTELEALSISNKIYTKINKHIILTGILSKIDSPFEMISIKGKYFVDSGLVGFEKDDSTLDVCGEHSKEHIKDTVQSLKELIKQKSDRTLFSHYVTYFVLPPQIYSIFTVHNIQYSCPTQIFDQNTEPCFVDLKHLQNKLTAFCGSPLSHTQLPDIDLSDIARHEQFEQILKTLNDLEKALQYKPPTDGSTGRPDESNMQNIWKLFERFLLQRFAIEIQEVSTSPFITLRNYFVKLARGEALSTEDEMRYEGLRFASFQRINVETSSLRLAAAGFYATGDEDETRCYSCGVTYRNWEMRDNPFVIHSRISPNCIHAIGTDERNVPIQPQSEGATVTPPREGHGSTPVASESESATQIQGAVGVATSNTGERYTSNQIVDEMPPRQSAHYSDSALSSPTSRLRFEDAVHPHYSNSGHRLESFRLWPEVHTHSPEELVRAGFFYAGYSDCVRCFVCGLGLRTWEEGDDPWVEHVRWRSSCAYVEAARGNSFIIQTLAAIGRATHTPEQNPGGIQQRSSNDRHNHDTSKEDILRTSACERALEMGFSRGQVMLAAQSTIASAGTQALTLAALLERILVVGSPDEAEGAQGGYSGGNSQEQNGQSGKLISSRIGNTDSRSSGEKNNTTRQAHLLRSPAVSTDSGYKSLPVENHVRLPPAQQTSGNVHTGHPSTNINYNLEIAVQPSPGAEGPEERGRPKESNAPVNRFSSFPTNRHEIKESDKIQKTDNKKGKGKEDRKATAEETRQLKESSACKICLEEPANIVFLPCGHLVACAVCSPALERCPICRKHIRGTIRVHMISLEKHIDHL